MSDDQPALDVSQSFGSVAGAYDRGRPGYPAEAVTWLLGDEPRIVLELGAGTGKLTAELVRQGHAVHATEPDAAMLAILSARVPGASAKQARAEEIPANDRSVDVVVVGQAFHWFDHSVALPEIARVLKPGGHLALVHHASDLRIPWVRRLGEILGTQEHEFDPREVLLISELFAGVEETTFRHRQHVNRETVLDLALSRSNIASLGESAREAKLAEVLAFYDDFGRGMDGMHLPYVTHCAKATLRRDEDASSSAEATAGETTGASGVSDGTDTDMLLIDFR